jgi:hypothetical protein
LKLQPKLFDVIITEPSNPWTAGVGSVFSKEFYELAATRLKPGGIMTQWFHLYETQDNIVDLVLRTFSSVFPYVEIWDSGADIIILGSLRPWATGPRVFEHAFAIDRVHTDMWMIDIQSPEALWAKQLASQRTGFAIAGEGPIQSDLFPILEYTAPKAFYMGTGSRMLDRYDERTRQQLLAPSEKRAVLKSLSPVNAQLIFNTFSTVNGELYGCLFGVPSGRGVPCLFQTQQPALPPPSTTALDQASIAFASDDLDQALQFVTFALQKNPNDARATYVKRIIERERQARTALPKGNL